MWTIQSKLRDKIFGVFETELEALRYVVKRNLHVDRVYIDEREFLPFAIAHEGTVIDRVLTYADVLPAIEKFLEQKYNYLRGSYLPNEQGIDNDLEYCFEYNTVKLGEQELTIADVFKVHAIHEGENDGESWQWVFSIKDGRLIYLQAGCDYTGWDCQSWVDFCGIYDPSTNPDIYYHVVEQVTTGKKKLTAEEVHYQKSLENRVTYSLFAQTSDAMKFLVFRPKDGDNWYEDFTIEVHEPKYWSE